MRKVGAGGGGGSNLSGEGNLALSLTLPSATKDTDYVCCVMASYLTSNTQSSATVISAQNTIHHIARGNLIHCYVSVLFKDDRII